MKIYLLIYFENADDYSRYENDASNVLDNSQLPEQAQNERRHEHQRKADEMERAIRLRLLPLGI